MMTGLKMGRTPSAKNRTPREKMKDDRAAAKQAKMRDRLAKQPSALSSRRRLLIARGLAAGAAVAVVGSTVTACSTPAGRTTPCYEFEAAVAGVSFHGEDGLAAAGTARDLLYEIDAGTDQELGTAVDGAYFGLGAFIDVNNRCDEEREEGLTEFRSFASTVQILCEERGASIEVD